MLVDFVDDANAPVTLGRQLGRGGEGSVFEIPRTSLVAKVYHRPAEQRKSEKLAAMTRLRSPTLSSIAAWPERRILDKNRTQTWGIVLPRVLNHREIHHLYSPAHRKVDFPSADWSFLVHVARNCAAAFECMHSAGHLIGDVNQGGVLVSAQGTVKLIDCDSFQIRDGCRIFTCDVGVPHFTAPELQGKQFRGLERARTHDEFGLAVLIFHLLFMGRHPFAGRFHGNGDMPIELAIQQGRFAYGAAAGTVQMTPPPHALRLCHVTPLVADLFERAFRHTGSHHLRPAAKEWLLALEELRKSLVTCSRFPGHKFVSGSSKSCPWCDIETAGGPDLFISITAAAKLNSKFDVRSLWNEVENVQAPKPPTTSTPSLGSTFPARLSLQIRIWGFTTAAAAAGAAAAVALALVGIAGALGWSFGLAILWVVLRIVSPYAGTRKRLVQELTKAAAELALCETQWNSEMGSLTKKFANKKDELSKKRSEYEILPEIFRIQEQALEANKRESQLRAFLRAHFIEDATIRGIGRGRVTVLRSFGIETALDVTPDRISAVDGFGPALTAAVLAWRSFVESQFKYDPKKAADPAERAAVLQRQSQKRAALETALTHGLSELQELSLSAEQTWQMGQRRYLTAAMNHEAAVRKSAALPLPTWAA